MFWFDNKVTRTFFEVFLLFRLVLEKYLCLIKFCSSDIALFKKERNLVGL